MELSGGLISLKQPTTYEASSFRHKRRKTVEHPVPTIGNPELLKLVMKDIEADPERWNQDGWFKASDVHRARTYLGEITVQADACGTTACLAGHILIREGYQPTVFGTFVSREGRRVNPDTVAAELLGLTETQTHDLFYYTTFSSKRVERGYRPGSPMTLEEFKSHVTEVTGVTFD
jgi:hypothetical protein